MKRFHSNYFKHLITDNCICDDEIYLSVVKDKDENELDISGFYYVLKKGNQKYLLSSEFIRDLPIVVNHGKKVSYKGKGYYLITDLDSAQFKSEKKMSFRKLVDSFADYEHTNSEDFLLYKILSLMMFIERNNLRACSPPGFGKDSCADLLTYLTGDVGKIENPTIAKLEYLLFNKLIMINELSGLDASDRKPIEKFLLSVGAFGNSHEKHSRAVKGGQENYDTSRLSLLLTYNDLDQYDNKNNYFDFMFRNKAVLDRFIPFKFRGKIVEQFKHILNVDAEVKKHHNYFVDFIRSIMFYRDNLQSELKGFSAKTDVGKSLGLDGRWGREFSIVLPFLDLYSKDEGEYQSLVNKLFNRHLDYVKMINGNNLTLNSEFVSFKPEIKVEKCAVIEEEFVDDVSDDKRVMDLLMKSPNHEMLVQDVMNELIIGEHVISLLKLQGLVFESKNGLIKVLE